MTPEEFRRHGHELVDWIADFRSGVARLPVMSRCAPGEIRRALPPAPPDTPEPFETILRDLDQTIVPGLTHWTHPQFFGYFPSNSDLSSALGDFASTGLGVLGLSWQSSPALTELEEVTTDWLRQMMGLADGWSGVIADTASTSTLVALVSARERTLGRDRARAGTENDVARLVVYASAHSHSSVEKAARVAGFRREHVRLIDVDADGRMRVDALQDAIATDMAEDRLPCAVVATVGTTLTTAADPVAGIAAAIAPHDMWLHVDAAMTGSAMILPECRAMWDGIERADSLVVNPHKWMGVAFDCSVYYVRDPAHLVSVMSTSPSYLQSAADAEVKNLRDWGIPLGRRFRALKIWFTIRSQGVVGLRTRLRRDLANARWLEQQIRATPGWQILAPVVLQTLCVRHTPPDLHLSLADIRSTPEPDAATLDALDRHTLAWVDRLNRSGEAYLTPAVLNGRWMARISIGALLTEREHVEALWTAMQRVVVG